LQSLIDNVVVECASDACDMFELKSNVSWYDSTTTPDIDQGVAGVLLEKATATGQSGEFSFLTQALGTTTLNGATVDAGWKAWSKVVRTGDATNIANIIAAIAKEQTTVSPASHTRNGAYQHMIC
jgi:hypothetical protein